MDLLEAQDTLNWVRINGTSAAEQNLATIAVIAIQALRDIYDSNSHVTAEAWDESAKEAVKALD